MNYTIRSEGGPHRFFAMIPHMADDDLDPFEYRLYGHLVRRASGGGACTASLRALAETTRMSVAKVRQALKVLAAKGYVRVHTPTEDERRRRVGTTVVLLDVWDTNCSRYQRPPAPPSAPNLTQSQTLTVSDMTQSEALSVSNMTQSEALSVSNMTQLEDKCQREERERVDGLAVEEARAGASLPPLGVPQNVESAVPSSVPGRDPGSHASSAPQRENPDDPPPRTAPTPRQFVRYGPAAARNAALRQERSLQRSHPLYEAYARQFSAPPPPPSPADLDAAWWAEDAGYRPEHVAHATAFRLRARGQAGQGLAFRFIVQDLHTLLAAAGPILVVDHGGLS